MNKIRKGDQVIVTTGRDKGKRGTVLQRVGEDAADGAGSELRDRLAHHARERLDLERRRKPDDGDDRGQQRERHLERERARVAEAVSSPEALDRVEDETTSAGAAYRLERVVALELLFARHGNGCCSRHRPEELCRPPDHRAALTCLAGTKRRRPADGGPSGTAVKAVRG